MIFAKMNRPVLLGLMSFITLYGAAVTSLPGQTRKDTEKWMDEMSGLPENGRQYKKYFKEADALMGKFEFERSITACEEALKYEPDDSLARAMIALNYYELGEEIGVKTRAERNRRIEIYNKMLRVADEGVARAPGKGECYFMRGLANARISTTKGVFSSLLTAKRIEKDWLEAIKHRSDYVSPKNENLRASSYIAIGTYYRLCPDFFLLKLIFGISGDPDKAVEYCAKAYEMDPTRIEIVKELGISYISRGLKNNNQRDIEQGKKYLEMVDTLPLRLKTDKIDKEHSRILLNNINLCPGYSRDQEQEITESAFRKAIK
jgi:tetratricopeptide (TPR) repeat protein